MGFHVRYGYAAMPYLHRIPWDSIFTDFRLEDLDPELFQAPSEKSVATSRSHLHRGTLDMVDDEN